MVDRELGITLVNEPINHVQGLKLLLSTASMSVIAALRAIALLATTVAFGLLGIRRDGSVALGSIIAKISLIVSALLGD